jgi:hypothetical protein
MALKVYSYDEFTETYTEHTMDGSMTSPIVTTHDSIELSVIQTKVFVRNDDPTKYYEDVTIKYMPVSVVVNNVNGWKFKCYSQDKQPTDMEWQTVSSGNEVILGDIGTTDAADLDYHPIWLRVEAPRGIAIGVYNDAYLTLNDSAEVPVGS